MRPRTRSLSASALAPLFAPALVGMIVTGAIGGCGDDDEGSSASTTTEEGRHGLTPEQASAVLVKLGDTTITVGEFADQLAEQSPYLRARYNSPERRREFLDNLVRFELLAAEAERRGMNDLPDIERTRKQMMIQQMMRELFEDRIQLSDITDDEIEAHYREHRAEFEKPEQVRASHILIKNRSAAQRVLDQVKANESDNSFFRRMAEQHNADEGSRDRFGDLRFFSRPAERPQDETTFVPDALAEAAFAIPTIGGIAPTLVETEHGFHIVKLTARRAALSRSLEEARRMIQNRLWRERREERIQAFVDELRASAEIEENFDLLAHVQIDESTARLTDDAGEAADGTSRTDTAGTDAAGTAGAERATSMSPTPTMGTAAAPRGPAAPASAATTMSTTMSTPPTMAPAATAPSGDPTP